MPTKSLHFSMSGKINLDGVQSRAEPSQQHA